MVVRWDDPSEAAPGLDENAPDHSRSRWWLQSSTSRLARPQLRACSNVRSRRTPGNLASRTSADCRFFVPRKSMCRPSAPKKSALSNDAPRKLALLKHPKAKLVWEIVALANTAAP